MRNYEITIIYDPKYKSDALKTFLGSVFNEKAYKLEELKKLEATYKIKGLSKVKYYLVNVYTDEQSIKTFQRRANFEKPILRSLVINLDTELGLNRNFQSHLGTKMLAKFLHKKFSEKDLFAQEVQAQSSETSKKFKQAEAWEEELDNVKVRGIFEQQLRRYMKDKSDFSAKKFFLNLGFKEEEIPKNIEKLVNDRGGPKRKRVFHSNKQAS